MKHKRPTKKTTSTPNTEEGQPPDTKMMHTTNLQTSSERGGRSSSTATQTPTRCRRSQRPTNKPPQPATDAHHDRPKPHTPGKTGSRNTSAHRQRPPQPTIQLQDSTQTCLRHPPRPTDKQHITTSQVPPFHRGRSRSPKTLHPPPWSQVVFYTGPRRAATPAMEAANATAQGGPAPPSKKISSPTHLR
jgi:hypothetical protein